MPRAKSFNPIGSSKPPPAISSATTGPGQELTFTLVPRGLGARCGIDRDQDGLLDRDELDAGTDPSAPPSRVRVLASALEVAVGSDLTLDAQIAPLPAPVQQVTWWKDGLPIAEATGLRRSVPAVSFADAGDYHLVIETAFASYASPPVHIMVAPLLVRVDPADQSVRLGSNATFTATTVGVGPFQFQWQFAGQDRPGAVANALLVASAQLTNEGAYRIRVQNVYGSVTSAPVRLAVLQDPAVIIPPLSQRVVAGGQATFSFVISGHPAPFGFLLRKSSALLTNYLSDQTSGFLTLAAVQPSNAGTYRIVVTNAANVSGLILDPVTLTVLADSDHDGLPDEWEVAHGLNPNDPTDAVLDLDQDGQTNLEEYRGGTDPRDDASSFKVLRIIPGPDNHSVRMEFVAASNQTYSVQARGAVDASPWWSVAEVVALPTNRLVSVTNRIEGVFSRYYRLVTPRIP
jgi:hypothetical protein